MCVLPERIEWCLLCKFDSECIVFVDTYLEAADGPGDGPVIWVRWSAQTGSDTAVLVIQAVFVFGKAEMMGQ